MKHKMETEGALGGATMAVATGYILEYSHKNYSIVFLIAGTAYLFALLVIQLLAPRLEPVAEVDLPPAERFSVGSFIGFGFLGLIFGSFLGWCVGLITRVAGHSLFEYMVIAGLVGAVIGVIAGLLIARSSSAPRTA